MYRQHVLKQQGATILEKRKDKVSTKEKFGEKL